MNRALPLLLASILLAACDAAPEPTAKPRDPQLITPTEALLKRLVIDQVGQAQVADTLRVPGRIDFDEQRIARIGASVTGRITSVEGQLGQVVHKGTVLAHLNSSDLSEAQLSYLKARSQLALHERAAERARLLFASDVIGSAELQRRETEFQISTAEARAAADQLRLLGFAGGAIERLGREGKIAPVTPVVATQGGVIVERHVTPGQVVQAADMLFSVAELSQLWAVAEVPERQAARVAVGQPVRIEVPALGDTPLEATLTFVSQTVNPDTRTVLVRCTLKNPNGRLKPDMLATMVISTAPEPRLVVPASAVVRENNIDHVFVAGANNSFRLTRVELGAEEEGRRVVIKGLDAGQKLVVDGAFHLNNARNNQLLEGSE